MKRWNRSRKYRDSVADLALDAPQERIAAPAQASRHQAGKIVREYFNAVGAFAPLIRLQPKHWLILPRPKEVILLSLTSVEKTVPDHHQPQCSASQLNPGAAETEQNKCRHQIAASGRIARRTVAPHRAVGRDSTSLARLRRSQDLGSPSPNRRAAATHLSLSLVGRRRRSQRLDQEPPTPSRWKLAWEGTSFL